MHEKRVTSIRINPLIWKEIRKYAIDQGMTVSGFIEQFFGVFLSPRSEKGDPDFSISKLDFFWEDELIDFNSGMLGSHPKQVVGKVIEYLYELGKSGSSSGKMSTQLMEEVDKCRSNFAFALGAKTDEIIFENNTTKSLRVAFDIISAITKHSGTGSVLTTDLEHNSVKRLLRIGCSIKEIRKVPLLSRFSSGCDKDDIVDLLGSAVDSTTRVLLVSHIPYIGGKLPVDDIVKVAKEQNHDLFCVIDGAHSLGQLNVDVKEMTCDFYGVGAHKFCLGVPSLGALYANIKCLEALSSVPNNNEIPIFDSFALSEKFHTGEELGSISGTAVVSFNEAFNLIYNHYGIRRVQERIKTLAEHFLKCLSEHEKTLEMVSPTHPDLISGIISIAIKKDYTYSRYRDLVERLERKHRIICKAIKTPPCMRICLHYFNSDGDIEKFLELLHKEI